MFDYGIGICLHVEEVKDSGEWYEDFVHIPTVPRIGEAIRWFNEHKGWPESSKVYKVVDVLYDTTCGDVDVWIVLTS